MSEAEDPEFAARFVPGTYGCHEALHLASVFADMVERHLLDHYAVQAKPEWKALADRAVDALNELYQAIGAVHLDTDAKAGPKDE